ncbi:hypothetical protein ACN08Y_10075 [Rothia sp. P5764]|uniref:hypothetical protein n=1 Tax=Rothia sp. P5764 TaxID=3402654 RepID=UPI003AC4DF4B
MTLTPAQQGEFERFVQWYFKVLESNRNHQPCSQWYLHPEAVERLIALWSASLTVAIPEVDETGTAIGGEDGLKLAMSLRDWWREADYHNKMLFEGNSSPFSDCTVYQHKDPHTYERAHTETISFPKIDWNELEYTFDAHKKESIDS